jgi:hypothetical protein
MGLADMPQGITGKPWHSRHKTKEIHHAKHQGIGHVLPPATCPQVLSGQEIADALAMVMRAPKEYIETPSGANTQETQFMKDLNWAGNRLGHAGLLKKVPRSHWELTPLGMSRDFSNAELALFVAANKK